MSPKSLNYLTRLPYVIKFIINTSNFIYATVPHNCIVMWYTVDYLGVRTDVDCDDISKLKFKSSDSEEE